MSAETWTAALAVGVLAATGAMVAFGLLLERRRERRLEGFLAEATELAGGLLIDLDERRRP